MLQIRPLIDAYIDANIVLLFAFLVWVAARRFAAHTPLRHDFTLQLRMTEGLIIAALLSPLLALALTQVNGALFPQYTLNAADIAVSQFLEGRVNMDAAQFQSILSARQNFVLDLAYQTTPLAKGLLAALLIGFVVQTVRTGVSIWRLHRLIGTAHRWRRFRRLDLRFSDQTTVPFSTRGMRRRHIVLPSTMLADARGLRIALAHELQHMRRGDLEWELGLVLLQPLFFWNPAFVLWKRALCELRELGCDQALIRRKRVTPKAYADCLLEVCKGSLARQSQFTQITPKVPFFNVTSSGGRRSFEALRIRIMAITSDRPTLRHPALLFWPPLIAASFVIAIGASAIKKPSDWSHDRLMLSTIVNLEALETRNSGLSLAGY